MKWSELKKLLIKQGYVFDSHGKKHDVYIKGNDKVIIPRHDSKEAPKGTYEKLKKQIGL